MIALKKIAKYDNFYLEDSATLKEAMYKMRENRDGSVIFVKEEIPVAILTESDIVNALGEKIDLNNPALLSATTTVITANENRPIEFAFSFLSEHNIRRIVLVNDEGRFAGVVRQEDLFDYLEEDVYKVDLKISDIIKTPQNILTLNSNETLYSALRLMKTYHIGSVVIMREGLLVGILTEKDILKLTYLEIDMHEPIVTHMSSPVVTVSKDDLVTGTITLMKSKKIRRILVTDVGENIIAILTNRDILKHIKGNYSRILQIKIRHAQEIMDLLPEAIVEVFESDNRQVIHWMNRRAKILFGESLIDKEVLELFNKQDWSDINHAMHSTSSIINRRVHIGEQNFEVSGTLSKNLNNRYIKLIFKDVTEHIETKRKLQLEIEKQIEKRLENEYLLMQQSKLATMGEMIGHIAHQWRQPLAQLGGIFMNLDSAYEFDELTKAYFKERVKNGNALIKYMSHTIEDFRHFFEPNRSKKCFDLETYIHNAINIIHASLTYHHIMLEVIFPKEPITISGYPSEFSQVILNLLDNAKDVLLAREIKDPKIVIETTYSDEVVTVCVSDNAGGIDDPILEKIFDIYFTTKKEQGGSGLGLYMSKLIIESKLLGKIYALNGSEGAQIFIKIEKE
ncbi:MAG: CBS domain-containing protein [Epsilonproteobacteria bacterium]|nr:CBS domain-containing protein [Campylobacterota bacterium]